MSRLEWHSVEFFNFSACLMKGIDLIMSCFVLAFKGYINHEVVYKTLYHLLTQTLVSHQPINCLKIHCLKKIGTLTYHFACSGRVENNSMYGLQNLQTKSVSCKAIQTYHESQI